MKARRYRMAVDIAMTALLPCLMAYSLIGEIFHELAGVAMLLLFICHHILNHNWLRGLLRGRYTPYRIFLTAVNLLLCVIMVCLPLSGIVLSRHLFRAMPIHGLSATARTVHLLCSYWGFVLMSLHLGLHIDAMLKRLLKKPTKKLVWPAIVVSLYGVYAFIQRDLPAYMTLRSQFVFFDFSQPRIFFFLDYLAMIVLFATIGYSIGQALKTTRPRGAA